MERPLHLRRSLGRRYLRRQGLAIPARQSWIVVCALATSNCVSESVAALARDFGTSRQTIMRARDSAALSDIETKS
jgi:hypothetical protein